MEYRNGGDRVDQGCHHPGNQTPAFRPVEVRASADHVEQQEEDQGKGDAAGHRDPGNPITEGDESITQRQVAGQSEGLGNQGACLQPVGHDDATDHLDEGEKQDAVGQNDGGVYAADVVRKQQTEHQFGQKGDRTPHEGEEKGGAEEWTAKVVPPDDHVILMNHLHHQLWLQHVPGGGGDLQDQARDDHGNRVVTDGLTVQ